jgi:hypothetical protein
MGCALLMVPGRPLPNVSLVSTWPLRHGPNAAVAINAAELARGHETFLSSRAADRKSATKLKRPPVGRCCQPLRCAATQVELLCD